MLKKSLIIEVGGYYNNIVRFLSSLTITKEIAENGLCLFIETNKKMENLITLPDTLR
jgi:4-aminobutyrate aminotransferase-like enzyme